MKDGRTTNWRAAVLIGLTTAAGLLAIALVAIHQIASHSL